ncbi:MAG: hypothetical protein IID15_03140 [Candidatus Marinimicrobia bacterium]|nr:hypothetical protein [Candidatus Neomarinimicrobiota bacterium]
MPVLGAGYVGDYVEDYATLSLKFTSYSTAWVPIALAGSPVVKVYAADETGTEVTTGIALSVDFDGVVGLNNVLIDLSSAAFYAVAKDYHVIITTDETDPFERAEFEGRFPRWPTPRFTRIGMFALRAEFQRA